jgi:heme-degrading monooxygenase HmoA
MIEIIREFVVKVEARSQFELAFGPGGAWSKLFAQSPGFRGTTLLRDTNNSKKLLVIDMWDTMDHREQMLTKHEDEYANLKAKFEMWAESEVELGVFRVLTEATVKPLGKARHKKRPGVH